MIPMKITPEEYAQYYSPAPNYLYVLRQMTYDKFGAVILPETILKGTLKFIGTGKILKLSPYKSDEEHIEYLKGILKDKNYITFEFHAIAQVQLMPQFEFENGIDVVELHIKDVSGYAENVEALIERQKNYEAEVEKKFLTKG